ncbi:MAG: ubiquitin-like protein Pup [Actinomycetota bacterium]
MAEREQTRRAKGPERGQVEDETATRPSGDDQKLDELLDEIDQVLEENAEEFVKNYIQKGGQ